MEVAETGQRAKRFIAETIECNGLVLHTMHSDRGTSMTPKSVDGLLTGASAEDRCPGTVRQGLHQRAAV